MMNVKFGLTDRDGNLIELSVRAESYELCCEKARKILCLNMAGDVLDPDDGFWVNDISED